MVKLDFKGTVKDAQGREFNITQTLALVLQHATEGDAVKLNAWATGLLVDDGKLTMDKADVITLRNFVSACPAINLIKANIFDRIDQSKED